MLVDFVDPKRNCSFREVRMSRKQYEEMMIWGGTTFESKNIKFRAQALGFLTYPKAIIQISWEIWHEGFIIGHGNGNFELHNEIGEKEDE